MFSSTARLNNLPLLPFNNLPPATNSLQEIQIINLASSESPDCLPTNAQSSKAQPISAQSTPLDLSHFFDLEIPHIKYNIYKYLSFSERFHFSQTNKACYSLYREALNINGEIRDDWIRFILYIAENKFKLMQNNIIENNLADSDFDFYKTTQDEFLSLNLEALKFLSFYRKKWHFGHLNLTENELDKFLSPLLIDKSIELNDGLSECREKLSEANLKVISSHRNAYRAAQFMVAIQSIVIAIFLVFDCIAILQKWYNNWTFLTLFLTQIVYFLGTLPDFIEATKEVSEKRLLSKGKLTSVDILEKKLFIIEKYNSIIPFILSPANYLAIYSLLSFNNKIQKKYIEKANYKLDELIIALRNIEHAPLNTPYRLA